MKLVIGDKSASSWSMRPWLVMRHAGISFTEINVHLYGPNKTDLSRYSPTSLVPVLHHGDLTIWDTLAICEYLNEKFPEKQLWPEEIHERALARSATAEMHSGFAALRRECPCDLSKSATVELTEAAIKDLKRLVGMVKDMRQRFAADGPFLAGPWSVADAFYTPVATRIRTYGLKLDAFGDDGSAQAYFEGLLKTPEFLLWEQGAAEQRAGVHH